ncbi:hypothetical protein V1512DRAFT_70260 [Lipomyces arxii]|uniref:uncharacterized protein n=1 Tax=Lipomyces arxii TaxID=56418 RepID=UPI0034CF04B0
MIPGTIKFEVRSVQRPYDGDARLSKQAPFSARLSNNQKKAYLIEVGYGTPSQTRYLQLDTGSSDMWVHASGYFVYDLTHNQIGIAPAVFNTTDIDIFAIPEAGIPPNLKGIGKTDT